MTGTYLHSIEQAYQGEVYGELLYALIAGVQKDPDHAEKWRMLQQMEQMTRQLMRELLLRHGGDTTESEDWKARARADFEAYKDLAWPDLLRLFSAELVADIAEYAELEFDCPPEDAAILQHLTDHEVVTKRFCDLELAGRGDISLKPVLAFCQTLQRS